MKSRCPRAENCVGIQAAGGLLSNGAELWDGSDGARQEVKKGAGGGKLGSYCPDKFLFVCFYRTVFICTSIMAPRSLQCQKQNRYENKVENK